VSGDCDLSSFRHYAPTTADKLIYAYDGLDRLVGVDVWGTAGDQSFAYNVADNMVWNSALCAGFATVTCLQLILASLLWINQRKGVVIKF
jgi:hypothetical protein